MRRIHFTKMVASGNDFVVVEGRNLKIPVRKPLIRKICDRKYGIGSDGLLFLEKSSKADVRMRIFNADGSQAEMCGNGARCAALYIGRYGAKEKRTVKLATRAGILRAVISDKDRVKINMTNPKDLRRDVCLSVKKKKLCINYIDTGVPHAVIQVGNIDQVPVAELGRRVRFHDKFSPRGTNVDFFKDLGSNRIAVRTYERGVEDETLACGTGSVASAIVSVFPKCRKEAVCSCGSAGSSHKVSVLTKGGEKLLIYFTFLGGQIKNVWLEGEAKVVYKGEYF